MEELGQVAEKSWGTVCEQCHGSGKNPLGARCLNCYGFGQVTPDPHASIPEGTKITRTMTETIEPAKPRIDFRGRAGPIKFARMKDFAITFEKALQEMSSPNAKYAKGAEMYVRLGLNVKGQELETERPDLYHRAVEQLTAIKPLKP